MASPDFDTALRIHAYSLPGSQNVKRRIACKSWLESSSVSKSGRGELSICLRYCCMWSPLYAEVCIDCETGIVCCEGGETLSRLLGCINEQSMIKGARWMMPALVSTLSKAIDKNAELIWVENGLEPPVRTDVRTSLEVLFLNSIRAMANHPALSACGRDSAASSVARATAVLDGVSFTVGLVATALHNVRRSAICKPVPHWLVHGVRNTTSSPTSSGSKPTGAYLTSSEEASSPHSHIMDFSAQCLVDAISGLPLGGLSSLVDGSGNVGGGLTDIPLDSLKLLYWLTCLCPVHLLRLPIAAPPASATFHVLHGPWLASWDQSEDDVQPLWDSAQAEQHGRYGESDQIVRWWHGTANDNGFSALCYGLRSMSGTRHAASGAMYGDGVYATNDIKVALQFANKRGVTWAGSLLALRGGVTAVGSTGVGVPLPSPTVTLGAGYTRPAEYRLVLELDIIAAPSNKIFSSGTDVTASCRVLSGPSVSKGARAHHFAVPASCYVVVPDDTCLWNKRLHVFDDSQQDAAAVGVVAQRSWCTIPNWLVMVCVLLLSGILASPRLQRLVTMSRGEG